MSLVQISTKCFDKKKKKTHRAIKENSLPQYFFLNSAQENRCEGYVLYGEVIAVIAPGQQWHIAPHQKKKKKT